MLLFNQQLIVLWQQLPNKLKLKFKWHQMDLLHFKQMRISIKVFQVLHLKDLMNLVKILIVFLTDSKYISNYMMSQNQKKVKVFISSIGPRLYQLLKNILYPLTYENQTSDSLQTL